jgi:hypothetical protein
MAETASQGSVLAWRMSTDALGFTPCHGSAISTPGKVGNLPRAYITPGLFEGGFQDVAVLSHEMAEMYNDPFVGFDSVHKITPWLRGAVAIR